MTWEQLRALAADGNDVGGHTLTHPNLVRLSASEREHEICADRHRLLANGLHPVSFAYPYGIFDAATARTVRSCGYLSARTSGSLSPGGPLYASPTPPPDRYATPTLAEREGPQSLSYLQSAVRAAAAHGGGWLQIMFHQVCRSSDRDYRSCMRSHRPVDFAVLSDFLYWLRYSPPAGTSVKTVRAVLDPN
jgi:peptidoglycan/xylan/chitin deacetylase (PgdA/CDA1 family)